MGNTQRDIVDAFRSFMVEREGIGFQFPDPQRHFFYEAVVSLLDGREADVFLSLELDGSVWTLVVVDDAVSLLRLDEDAIELRFLGPLRGSYSERIEFTKEADMRVTLRFEDERLPGGLLELEVPPPRVIGGFPDDLDEERREPIEKLRRLFRVWAGQASPSA